MLPVTLLSKQQVSLHHPAASKKKALETAATLLAAGNQAVSSEVIFEKLLERERLGSTGLANGIALPHARMSGITEPVGALLTLENPIEFDALDGKPVDLIFALLVPEDATEEHLGLLAAVAQTLRSSSMCQLLRDTKEPLQAISLLTAEV